MGLIKAWGRKVQILFTNLKVVASLLLETQKLAELRVGVDLGVKDRRRFATFWHAVRLSVEVLQRRSHQIWIVCRKVELAGRAFLECFFAGSRKEAALGRDDRFVNVVFDALASNNEVGISGAFKEAFRD